MNNMAIVNEKVQDLVKIRMREIIDFETGKTEYIKSCATESGGEFRVFAEEKENVIKRFNEIIEKIMKNPLPYERTQRRTIYARIRFTRKECKQMNKNFKKDFEKVGRMARVEKSENEDKHTFTYTIRYSLNGYGIAVSSLSLKEAKRQFIQKTNEIGA